MNIHLFLIDQLNQELTSFRKVDKKQDIILFVEDKSYFLKVKHHKKKIIFLISSMRHFAKELVEQGYHVNYVKIDDKKNSGCLKTEVQKAITKYNAVNLILTEPSEYDQLSEIKSWELTSSIKIYEDNRFLCSKNEFTKWASKKNKLRMEFFYRMMRIKFGILMNKNDPEGGKWNYDSENRKVPDANIKIPKTYEVSSDDITEKVITAVEENFSDHFGDIFPFHYAVTRQNALLALDKFISERLVNYGDYQDAMIEKEPWLYHSHISLYINNGLLTPLECIKKVEQAYYDGIAPLNAVEGFIRQILGWREYVRGVYWLKMPSYKHENYFNAKRSLPDFFWGEKTKLNCISQCVSETKKNAYAHHIQRLMVLGNFALLAGLDVNQVNEWYLIVYADAFEWVEMPNVSGMVLFADGGFLASKPYAASGSYINKMSNYCKNCEYNVKEKNGMTACPFNYLYWHFLINNREKLSSNPRLKMIYNSLDRMPPTKINMINKDSDEFLKQLKSTYN